MGYRCTFLTFLVLNLCPVVAVAKKSCSMEPGKLRYEDNIACFRDPEARKGFPGLLKLIPLDDNGDAEVSFGGEVRQRYEYTHDPLFGADPQDRAGVWLQRYTLHADLRIGSHARVFGQLSSALEAGRHDGPGPVDENELALQNAFLDLSFAPSQTPPFTLRAGRQEIQYGSGRLVDVREGPNVRRTFDAARGITYLPNWQVDVLVARPRIPRHGVFDDEASDQQTLWGIYATGDKFMPMGGLDLYYLGFVDDAGAFVQGVDRERRHSIGARIWGSDSGWDWNWETVYQFGSFGNGDIEAWTLATETGRTLAEVMWQPRLALSINIASGDDDPTDADLGTFNPLFPRGNYFSQEAVLGPRNFFNIHPFVTIHPSRAWSLTADMNLFWRLETTDGVYAPGGQLIRAPNGSDERFVGSALSLTSDRELAENLTFTAIYTHFFAGDFIRDTGPSEDIDFVEVTLQLRF
jgi:hypothetical protein